MNIKVELDSSLNHYDTGGGVREIDVVISISDSLTPRMKRKVLFHEVLGTIFGYLLSPEQIDDVGEDLLDALDQLEPVSENNHNPDGLC